MFLSSAVVLSVELLPEPLVEEFTEKRMLMVELGAQPTTRPGTNAKNIYFGGSRSYCRYG
jgi:hypothetical protein